MILSYCQDTYSSEICVVRQVQRRCEVLAVLGKIGDFLKSIVGKKKESAATAGDDTEELCCNGMVHIYYRGLSDDRLYKAANRKWAEVRFYKPNGLKVFCADCRRSLL